MEEETKKQARELLIKSKVYRIIANIFAFVGVIIFIVLYFSYFKGDVMASLRDPITILFVIFPFVPAIILSLKGKKAEGALQKLLSPPE
jgi:hypothetical protein